MHPFFFFCLSLRHSVDTRIDALPSHVAVQDSLLTFAAEALVAEIVSAVAKSLACLVFMTVHLSNGIDVLPKGPTRISRVSVLELSMQHPYPDNEDSSEIENDDEDDDGEEDQDDASEGGDDSSGEQDNDGNVDPDNDPLANGEGGSDDDDDDEEEEENEDDDGEDVGEGEDDDEEEEEKDENIVQPPTKRRK